MLRQDYIMRMIEQLARVLTKVLFNKENKNYVVAFNEVENGLKNIVGLDYHLVSTLSDKDILSLLSLNREAAYIKCIVIAKLLKEGIEIKALSKSQNIEPTHIYLKALSLYLEGILRNTDDKESFSTYYSDVDELINKIEEHKFSPEIRYKVFQYYELQGKFDLVNDELLKLKALNYDNINYEGIQFYEKLKGLKDEELGKGKITREEILKGLKEFTNKSV